MHAQALRPIALPGNSLRTTFLLGGILFLATFLAYWNCLPTPFIFDDIACIVENPTIRNLADLGTVLSPPNNGSGVTGRPVVNLSLAINYAFGGLSVRGYHLANVGFHIASGLLLFGIIRRTLAASAAATPYRFAATAIAFVTTLLWLLHPLQTESVTCVIQRTELLVGLFYLLTLYAFIRAVETQSVVWKAIAIASCAIGMATKEVMVTAPVVILFYDRTFLAGSFADAWRQRRQLHLALAGTWLVLGALLVSMGGARGEVAGFDVGVTWWAYALKQAEAVLLYLRLTVWPHPLVLFYGVDVVSQPLDVLPELLVIALLVGATVYALWKRPAVGFCGAWFFGILAPSSSIVPLISQTVSEHRMYLPLAGILALGVGAAFRLHPRHARAALLAVAGAHAVLTVRRNVDYRSDLSIWNDTVAKAPDNARARVNLGAALKAAGDSPAALVEYERALQRPTASAEALNNLATLLIESSRFAEAVDRCRAALQLRPNFSLAHHNLGTALVELGRLEEGVGHLQTALRFKPELAEAHCNLAHGLTLLGQPQQAIPHAETAVKLNPKLALAYFHLSSAHLKLNQIDQAKSALEKAIAVSPDYAEAHSNLGSLLYQSGNAAAAVPHYEAAVRVKPAFVDARSNLASALFQTGRVNESIEQYREVIRQQPGYAEAHFNLGLVLSRSGRNAEAVIAYQEALRLRPDDARARNELARLQSAPPKPGP